MVKKIISIEKLKEIVKKKQQEGYRIVFTNGCFDILHVGHARYLTTAKEKGDLLVVGLNSDSSVVKLKGSKRPLIGEKERAEMLSYLEMVDYITVFEELTAKNVISSLQPDLYVKGGDYKIEELPEARVVKEYGGKIELIPVIEGASTSNILEEILKRYQ